MIGRSLVIFQLGNNRNEIHEVNSWEFALGASDKDFAEKIIKEAKKKKWKPEAIVKDKEVKAIVYATNCIKGEPGYHKWASDGVYIINRSGDPNLYNPAKEKAEKRRIKENKRKESLEKLKEYLPELIKLRNAIPVGTIEISMTVPLRVKFDYHETFFRHDVVGQDGKGIMWSTQVVSLEQVMAMPEAQAIVNCPHRAAYLTRCESLAQLLELNRCDVENATYFAILKIEEIKSKKRKDKQ